MIFATKHQPQHPHMGIGISFTRQQHAALQRNRLHQELPPGRELQGGTYIQLIEAGSQRGWPLEVSKSLRNLTKSLAGRNPF